MNCLKTLMLLTLGVGWSVTGWTGGEHDRTTIPFSATKILIEVNATDGDSGLQLFLDGVGWERVGVFDPHGEKIFRVRGKGSVGLQGVTELFFESAEPSFDDLPLDEFLERFPEGQYTFVGRSVDGDRLVSTAELTHNLPAGPVLISPEEDAVVATNAVIIMWEKVTSQFTGDPLEGEIVGYQVLVEQEEPVLRVFSADVTADVTMVTVPPEFMLPGVEYKYEVLAIEESGNQTLSERAFSTLE